MLLREFLRDNMPSPKGSIKIPMKGILDMYDLRYNTLSRHKSFHHDVYKTSPGGRVIVHVKVPSETLEKFYYDVLLEVEPVNNAISLKDCNVKFFSNCPTFIFQQAFLFAHTEPDGTDTRKTPTKRGSGIIIPSLRRKIPEQRLLIPGVEEKVGDAALDNPPDIRNPHRLLMLDKSLYFAVRYLLDNVPLGTIMRTKRNRTEAQIFSSVMDFDTLMMNRKKEEAREKQRKSEINNVTKSKKAAPRGASVSKIKPVNKISKHQSKSVHKVNAIGKK